MGNILVIGASNGIGQKLAENLSESHNVFGTFNKTPRSHSTIKYHFLDVLEDEINFDFLPETIDSLIYCPGSISLKPFHRFSAVEFENDYKLQVVGAVKCIQSALPKLKLGNNPSIVLFSTVANKIGLTFHSQVSSSKGAIEGLTKALAAEFSPKIRVNCVAPSITDTPLANGLLNTEQKIEANASRHPLKRIGTPEDIAQIVEFLISDKSSWITGQSISVDGGFSTIKI